MKWKHELKTWKDQSESSTCYRHSDMYVTYESWYEQYALCSPLYMRESVTPEVEKVKTLSGKLQFWSNTFCKITYEQPSPDIYILLHFWVTISSKIWEDHPKNLKNTGKTIFSIIYCMVNISLLFPWDYLRIITTWSSSWKVLNYKISTKYKKKMSKISTLLLNLQS